MATPTTTTTAADAFKFLPQGGIIQEFRVGGHNIVLGFPSAASYANDEHPFFGENIGRVCNRISNAQINSLNGRSYPLAANNGPNTLHGGKQGWGKKVFQGPQTVQRKDREALLFTYLSPDGEEGFPGTVEFRLWYYPSVDLVDGKEVTSLELEYEAELIGDNVEETVVSLTNHSYFNLSDGPTITGTRAKLTTNLHQLTDAESIPTGSIEAFPGIPANEEFTFGAESPDPDHCFVLPEDAAHPENVPLDTRNRPLRSLVTLSHPATRIHFEALSTEPAFQLYAGRYINVAAKDGMPARGTRSGMCIEASRFVNAVNEDAWRHMVVLRKGQLWGSRTVYRAWVDAA